MRSWPTSSSLQPNVNPWIATAIAVGTVLFNAGFTYAYIKLSLAELRKDMNGVGRKVNAAEIDGIDDRVAIAVMLMLVAPEAKREAVAGLLIGARRR